MPAKRLFKILLILGLMMNKIHSHEIASHNISHERNETTFEAAKQTIHDKILSRGDLPYLSVEKQLDLLEQLAQFELGRFLIERKGLNGFWTHYVITYPEKGKVSGLSSDNGSLHPLEKYLLDRTPVILATQERFKIFKGEIQKHLHEGCALASVPCGLMACLLELDYSSIANFTLHGIDLDPDALSQASAYAEYKNLEDKCQFTQQDAWNLSEETKYTLITSNGLNIYEPDDGKVVELYRQFYKCLRPQGVLVVSFLTPPPAPGLTTEWKMDEVDPQDALLQKIIFSDILGTKWQAYRPEKTVVDQLKQAGFVEIEILYDKAHLFPTAIAKKR